MVHTEAGSAAGTVATFASAATEVSAHYAVSLTGDVDQFVAIDDRAWANGILEDGNAWLARVYPGRTGPTSDSSGRLENPNNWTVSVETEDLGRGSQAVTDEQYAAVLELARRARARYPSIRWLLRHADVSPRSRAHCPGDRWLASGRFAELAEALGWQTTTG